MRIVRSASIVLAAVWLLLGGVEPARAADGPSDGQLGGLFGSPNPRRPGQNASVEATLRESYDGNILGDQGTGGAASPRIQLPGVYSALDTIFSYDRQHDRSMFSFGLASTARYYPSFDRVHLGAQSARLESGQPLWRGARLRAFGDARYSPRFGVDPGEAAALPSSFLRGVDDSLVPLTLGYYRAGAAGEIQQSVGEVTVLSFTSNLRASELEGQSTLRTTVGAGASLQRQSGRHTTWRASYGQQRAERGSLSGWISQEATLGFDRRVPLSPSREATYSLSTGSTILSDGRQAPRYRVTGDVRASYPFGRSWNGAFVYRRGVGFVEPLPDPLVFDSLAFELTGLTTRWMEWFASGAFQRGGVGLSTVSSNYDLYTARTRVTASLSRTVAVYGEYFLYQYQFGEAVRLPIGLGRSFDRQGASVGIRLHAFF